MTYLSVLLGMLGCLSAWPLSALCQTQEQLPDASRQTTQPLYPTAQTVYLNIHINGQPLDLVAPFREHDGALSTSLDELRQIGLRNDDLVADANGDVALARIPGLSYRYVPAMQEVQLTVNDARRLPYVVNDKNVKRVPVTPGTGAVINYDAFAEHDERARVGVYSEQRFFHPGGVLINRGFVTHDRLATRAVRLDTAWTHADPDALTTLQVGDLISGGLNWARSVRLGGVQLRRNFDLRSDLITYPLPVLGGSAAVPSAVDIYINNVRQTSVQVPSGPFVLNNAPALNGAGQAVIVVRDVLGRDVATSVPLYIDTRLLKPGLIDYSVEAGLFRENYGLRSFDYDGRPAVSGSLRYGWNETITLEGHAEAMPNTYVGGVGVLVKAGMIGVFSGSAAASTGRNTGTQLSLGYQLRTSHLTLDVQGSRAFSDYEDLAARAGAMPPRHLYRGTLALQVGNNSNIALSFLQLDQGSDYRSRIGSVAFTSQVTPLVTVSANAYRDFARGKTYGVMLSLSTLLGEKVSTTVSVGREGGNAGGDTSVYASAQRTPDYDGGWGWQVQGARAGGSRRAGAQAEYRGRYGEVMTGVRTIGGQTIPSLNISGAVVAMDGEVLAGRRITQGFAVVSTDGVANVPVLISNRRLGMTNANGYLLVPDLLPYESNQLAIDALNLPANTRLTATRQFIAPAWQAGALVRFGVTPFHGGQIILVDTQDQPLPPGTQVTLQETGARTIVGYDGLVFFDALQTRNTFRAATRDGACVATLAYIPGTEPIPMLGRVICRQGGGA